MFDLVIITAVIVSLWLVSRRLPLQNTLAAGVLIFVITVGAEALATKTGFPYLPVRFSQTANATVPWKNALVWVALVLIVRELTRKILVKSKTATFGLWLLGVVAIATAILWLIADLSSRVSSGEKLVLSFVGRFIVAVICLLAITPWMIDKKPRSPAT